MAAQHVMPDPLRRMFEYLDIDVERSFELVPDHMNDAMVRCRMCRMFHDCDHFVESRYFICPNRGLLDRLEDLLQEN